MSRQFWLWLFFILLVLGVAGFALGYMFVEPKLHTQILWKVAPPPPGTLELYQQDRRTAAALKLVCGETVYFYYHGRWDLDQLQWQYSINGGSNWLIMQDVEKQSDDSFQWTLPKVMTQNMKFQVISTANPKLPPATLNSTYALEPSWSWSGPGDTSGDQVVANTPIRFTVDLDPVWAWGSMILEWSDDQVTWTEAQPVVFWSDSSQYQFTPAAATFAHRNVYFRIRTDTLSRNFGGELSQTMPYSVLVLPPPSEIVEDASGQITSIVVTDQSSGSMRFAPGATVLIQWETDPESLIMTDHTLSWSELPSSGFTHTVTNGILEDHSAIVNLPQLGELSMGSVVYFRIASDAYGYAVSAPISLSQYWAFWHKPDTNRVWTYNKYPPATVPVSYWFEMPMRIIGPIPADWMDTSNWQLDLELEDGSQLIDVAAADSDNAYGSLSLNYTTTPGLYIMHFQGWVGKEFGRMGSDWTNNDRQDLVSFTPRLTNKLVDDDPHVYPVNMTLVRASGGSFGSLGTSACTISSIEFLPDDIIYVLGTYRCKIRGANLGPISLFLRKPNGQEFQIPNGPYSYWNGGLTSELECGFSILSPILITSGCKLVAKATFEYTADVVVSGKPFGVHPQYMMEGVSGSTPQYIGDAFWVRMNGAPYDRSWTYTLRMRKNGGEWSDVPNAPRQFAGEFVEMSYTFSESQWSLTDQYEFAIVATNVDAVNSTMAYVSGQKMIPSLYHKSTNTFPMSEPYAWRLQMASVNMSPGVRTDASGDRVWIYTFGEKVYVTIPTKYSIPSTATFTIWMRCTSPDATKVPNGTWFSLSSTSKSFALSTYDTAQHRFTLTMPDAGLVEQLTDAQLMFRVNVGGEITTYFSDVFDVQDGFKFGTLPVTMIHYDYSIKLHIEEGVATSVYSDDFLKRGAIVRFQKKSVDSTIYPMLSYISNMNDTTVTKINRVGLTPVWVKTTFAAGTNLATHTLYDIGAMGTPTITTSPAGNTYFERATYELKINSLVENLLGLECKETGKSRNLSAGYTQENATEVVVTLVDIRGRTEQLTVANAIKKLYVLNPPAPFPCRIAPEDGMSAVADLLQAETISANSPLPTGLKNTITAEGRREAYGSVLTYTSFLANQYGLTNQPVISSRTSVLTKLTSEVKESGSVVLASSSALGLVVAVPVYVARTGATNTQLADGTGFELQFEQYNYNSSGGFTYVTRRSSVPVYMDGFLQTYGFGSVPAPLLSPTNFHLPVAPTGFMCYGDNMVLGLAADTLTDGSVIKLQYGKRLLLRPYTFTYFDMKVYYYRVVINGQDSNLVLGKTGTLSTVRPALFINILTPGNLHELCELQTLEVGPSYYNNLWASFTYWFWDSTSIPILNKATTGSKWKFWPWVPDVPYGMLMFGDEKTVSDDPGQTSTPGAGNVTVATACCAKQPRFYWYTSDKKLRELYVWMAPMDQYLQVDGAVAEGAKLKIATTTNSTWTWDWRNGGDIFLNDANGTKTNYVLSHDGTYVKITTTKSATTKVKLSM